MNRIPVCLINRGSALLVLHLYVQAWFVWYLGKMGNQNSIDGCLKTAVMWIIMGNLRSWVKLSLDSLYSAIMLNCWCGHHVCLPVSYWQKENVKARIRTKSVGPAEEEEMKIFADVHNKTDVQEQNPCRCTWTKPKRAASRISSSAESKLRPTLPWTAASKELSFLFPDLRKDGPPKGTNFSDWHYKVGFNHETTG